MIHRYLAVETAQAKELMGFCKIYNFNATLHPCAPFTHTMYDQYILAILITFNQIDQNFQSSYTAYRPPVGPVYIGSL